jgi:hypothetical protein
MDPEGDDDAGEVEEGFDRAANPNPNVDSGLPIVAKYQGRIPRGRPPPRCRPSPRGNIQQVFYTTWTPILS